VTESTVPQVQPKPALFMGLPIQGEFSPEKQISQLPVEQLYPIVQAVLNDPDVERFGWRQHIPSFNDGEPCEFTVGDFWVQPADSIRGSEEDCRYCGSSEHPCDCEPETVFGFPEYGSDTVFGRMEYSWADDPETGTRKYNDPTYEGPDPERYERLHALYCAIEGGQFDHALQEQFGNNIRISISKHLVEITEYGDY